MVKRGKSKGFTIVELLVVIIVVAILATLIALSYGNAQTQARDTQMRDAADKFADAIKLMQTRTGMFPKGGYGSTTAVSATTGCTDGANGWQVSAYYAKTANTNYKCTIGDAAVAMGYLPSTFFDNLPYNTLYGGLTEIFMVYPCGTSYYLFYSLEKASNEEAAALNTLAAGCGSAATARDTYKMRAIKNLSAI